MDEEKTNRGGYFPETEAREGVLTIRYGWWKNGMAYAAPVMLFIASVLLWAMRSFYWCLLTGGGGCWENRSELIVDAGVSVFIALLLYFGVGLLLNVTVVTVSRTGIIFRSRFFRYSQNRKVPASKIRGIYVRERSSKARIRNQYPPFYSVVVGKSGLDRIVYGEFYKDQDSANQLAQSVRIALGLENKDP